MNPTILARKAAAPASRALALALRSPAVAKAIKASSAASGLPKGATRHGQRANQAPLTRQGKRSG